MKTVINHLSSAISVANLISVNEGNEELLTSHPRLRTAVRLYGLEDVIATVPEVLKAKGVILSSEDVEALVDKVESKLIPFTLTERTEEEKMHKDAFDTFKKALVWSSISSFLLQKFGTGDAVLDNVLRMIRSNTIKMLTPEAVKKTVEVIESQVGKYEAYMLTSAISKLRELAGLKLGSIEPTNNTKVIPSTNGIMVYVDDQGYRYTDKKKALLKPEYFTQEMQDKISRVRTKGAKFASYLTKAVFLVESGISLNGMSRNDIYMATQMVTNEETGYHKLEVIPHPTLEWEDTNMNKTGFIESSKANDGMFTYYPKTPVQYPGLAEQHNGVFNSICDGKKFAARQEKLNKDREDAYSITLENVVLIKEVPDEMNSLFNTGCFYLATESLMKYGVCRIVSNISNGMLKGATNLSQLVDETRGISHSYICSSSYKGGLNGVLRATGFEADLSKEIVVTEDFWDEYTFSNGTVVKAKVCTLECMITNPYTLYDYTTRKSSVADGVDIDSVDAETAEKLAEEYESEGDSKALAMEMLSLSENNGNIMDVVRNYKNDYNLSLKKPLTTVVSSDFAAVRNTYGKEITEQLIKALVNSPLNKPTKKRKYAFDLLKGEYNVLKSVQLADVISKLEELAQMYDVSLAHNNFSSASRNFLLMFVSYLEANTKEKGWIELEHGDKKCYFPVGNFFYGDLLDTSNTIDKVVVTGILSKVLEHLAHTIKFRNKNGEYHTAVIERLFSSLTLEVQWKLLNKDFGRLKTKGKYFVALPGTWLENKYDVCLPGRDRYVPKKGKKKYVKGNMGKQPIIFHGSFAGCRVFKDIPGLEMSDDLREILSCVVFVHPEYLLELQNDADGDLIRITFDSYILPLYDSKVLEQEGRNFFKAYIEDEKDFAVSNSQKVKTFTPRDLAEAIHDAAISKQRVGAYTDMMHIMATHIDSSCKEIKMVTEEVRQMVVRVFGVLIQECAMNAIKHNGNGEDLTVADCLSKFRLFQVDKKTEKNVGIQRAINRLTDFFVEGDWQFDSLNLTQKDAAILVVAVTKQVMGTYDSTQAEMIRKIFKNMPTIQGEPIEYTNTFEALLVETAEDTFSMLFKALCETVE